MHDEARFTRLTMVRLGGTGGGLRRYGLARLDEVALATPPAAAAESPGGDGPDDGAPPCDA